MDVIRDLAVLIRHAQNSKASNLKMKPFRHTPSIPQTNANNAEFLNSKLNHPEPSNLKTTNNAKIQDSNPNAHKPEQKAR